MGFFVFLWSALGFDLDYHVEKVVLCVSAQMFLTSLTVGVRKKSSARNLSGCQRGL